MRWPATGRKPGRLSWSVNGKSALDALEVDGACLCYGGRGRSGKVLGCRPGRRQPRATLPRLDLVALIESAYDPVTGGITQTISTAIRWPSKACCGPEACSDEGLRRALRGPAP